MNLQNKRPTQVRKPKATQIRKRGKQFNNRPKYSKLYEAELKKYSVRWPRLVNAHILGSVIRVKKEVGK
jgi:hypothetical protein